VEVESILQRELAKLTENKWEEHKDEQLMKDLLARKTDPYTVAGKILQETLLTPENG
jgi:LAO/AO transport system kinase